jgi:large subunit ribosomal protein L29
MKASEVKEMTTEEIVEKINAGKEELSKIKINHKISDLENPMVIRHKRRDIAKLSTELSKRKSETAK